MSRVIVLPVNDSSNFDRAASLPAPAAPNLASVTPDDEQNTLVWNAVSGATNYNIYFDTTSGITDADTQIIAGNVTSFDHTGLSNGVEYFYRVQAEGPTGALSTLSNEDSATPAAFVNTFSTDFDGIDEFITFGNNHNYDRTDNFTFSAWIKPDNFASQGAIWAKVNGAVEGWGMYVSATTGTFFLQMRPTSGTNRAFTSTGTFTSGSWNHIAVTHDGSNNINGIRVYINNAAAETPASGSLGGTLIVTNDSQIGRRNTSFPFNGHIEEVSFWSATLDSTEISEIYNSGIPGDLVDHSEFPSLDHWYRMGDGDTFPTIEDQVGSADGTMTNMESGDIDADVPS